MPNGGLYGEHYPDPEPPAPLDEQVRSAMGECEKHREANKTLKMHLQRATARIKRLEAMLGKKMVDEASP